MFQFHVQSQNLAEAMRKISIAIPAASEKGENDGIKLAFYKNVAKINKSVGLLLAFDGKIQAVSSLEIEDTGSWKANLNKVHQALAIYEVTMETPCLEISRKGDSQICFHGKDELSSAAVVCAQKGEIHTVKIDERELKYGLGVFNKEKEIIVETSSETLPIILRQHEDDPNRIAVMVLSD